MKRQVSVVTPENAEITYVLAGIGSRIAAAIIDFAIQAIVGMITTIALFAGVAGFSILIGSPPTWMIAILIISIFLLTWGYFILFEIIWNGQSPGKRAMRLRVIKDDGQPIDYTCAIIRNLVRAADFLPFGYTAGMVSVIVSPTYRRIGDYAAGTVVVRERAAYTPEPEAEQQTQASVEPFAGDTSSLTKSDYEAIERYLNRRSELTPDLQTELVRKIATPIMEKLGLELPAQTRNFNYAEILESLHIRNKEEKRSPWSSI